MVLIFLCLFRHGQNNGALYYIYTPAAYTHLPPAHATAPHGITVIKEKKRTKKDRTEEEEEEQVECLVWV